MYKKTYLFLFFILTSTFSLYSQTIQIEEDSIINKGEKTTYKDNIKKKWKSIILSLFIPGYYHIKEKKDIKTGIIYMVNDLIAIGGYEYFNYKGDQTYDHAIRFADNHFDPYKYWDFRKEVLNNDTLIVLSDVFEFDYEGHEIQFDSTGKVIKDFDYYEMIGKYKKFTQGWDDATPTYYEIINTYRQLYIPVHYYDSTINQIYVLRYASLNPDAAEPEYAIVNKDSVYYIPLDKITPEDTWYYVPSEFPFGKSFNALYYMSLRKEANTYYDYANYMLIFLIANHLTSFFHSLYLAATNNILDNPDLSFKISPIYIPEINSKGLKIVWSF